MTMSEKLPLHLLFSKLSRNVPLSGDEAAALHALPISIKRIAAGKDLSREGDMSGEVCVVLEGLVCRYKIVAEGGRQIQAYHLPGDVPDLTGIHVEQMDHNLGALRASTVARISHRALRGLISAHPEIGARLWRETVVENAIAREWISNIGRRSARARVAHLICELLSRYRALHLATDTLPLAVTQIELGDSQGLSAVHVNRVMKELKKAKLVVMSGHLIKVLDWERLKFAGDFDAAYLHLGEAVH